MDSSTGAVTETCVERAWVTNEVYQKDWAVSCGTVIGRFELVLIQSSNFCGTDALVPHLVVVPNAIRTTMRDGVSPQRDNCTNATVRSVLLLVHWAYR